MTNIDISILFQERPTYEKVVIVSFVFAVLLEVAATVYVLVSFCACCCKGIFLKLLPILIGLYTVFLFVGIIFYGLKYKKDARFNYQSLTNRSYTTDDVHNIKEIADAAGVGKIGYSYAIAVFAAILGAVSLIFSTIVGFCAKTGI